MAPSGDVAVEEVTATKTARPVGSAEYEENFPSVSGKDVAEEDGFGEGDEEDGEEGEIDELEDSFDELDGKGKGKGKVKKEVDPTAWKRGLFDCCTLPPKQGFPCCISNLCCPACIWGNAMELAQIGDLWPTESCNKVCRGPCCPKHLIEDQCLPACCCACDLYLNIPHTLHMGKKVAKKYGIQFGTYQVATAILCPMLFRIQVQGEIMEREGLVYFSECGLCEIITEPEEEEKEEEEAEEGKASAFANVIAQASASAATTDDVAIGKKVTFQSESSESAHPTPESPRRNLAGAPPVTEMVR